MSSPFSAVSPPGNNVAASPPPPPLVDANSTLSPSSLPQTLPTAAFPNGSAPAARSSGGLPLGTMAFLTVVTVFGAVIVLIIVGFVIYYRTKKREEAEIELGRSPMSSFSGHRLAFFTEEELERATDNFSQANLLGHGGFGYVHKGVLPGGKLVAIKQLIAGRGQGEREFQAEIETISRIHHRHIVSLVGYCITGAKRMLVYEFIPNNTLEFHLHGDGRTRLRWSTRMNIAIGAAKGLAYLHEGCKPRIIHRDVKASNILLDGSFEAKIADFGLARDFPDTHTHVSTQVAGTRGYWALESVFCGRFTDKSDVYSFGVVLLELITGRRAIDRTQSQPESIVDWARPLLERALYNDNYDALVDPNLQGDYDASEIRQMISCAAACIRHSAQLRPRMGQVVRALERNVPLDDLSEGVTAGRSSVSSSDYSSDQSAQEISSSEYNTPTSEFGQNM